MPQEKNTLLRILVPIGAVIAAGLVIAAVFTNSGRQVQKSAATTPTPTPAPAPASEPTTSTATPEVSPSSGTPQAEPGATPPDTQASAQPTTSPTPTTPNTPTPTPPTPATPTLSAPAGPAAPVYRAEVYPIDLTVTPYRSVGSLDKAENTAFRVDISPLGAGIAALRLSDHFESIKEDSHVVLQREEGDAAVNALGQPQIDPATGLPPLDGRGNPILSTIRLAPLGAIAVEIDGVLVDLAAVRVGPDGTRGPVWKEGERPGLLSARVLDEQNTPVVRIDRAYSVTPGTHSVSLFQHIHNETDRPLRVRFVQYGLSDLPPGAVNYGGDRRHLKFGYLIDPALDPSRQFVLANDFWYTHADVLAGYADTHTLWPSARSTQKNYTLSWLGQSSRHFGVALHPILDIASGGPQNKAWTNAAVIDRLVLQRSDGRRHTELDINVLRLTTPVLTLAPGKSHDLSMALFAGPLIREEIRSDPSAASLNLDEMVVYSMGGPCAFCTFPFMTNFLLWLLRTLHNYVFFDWSLAIIALVVVVRTILHPVTKWSQVRMQRFGKQMQGMAPKQQKLREKYEGDSKKLQEETAKLWREEGISPFGMLGCIPMFLQMPIWIALYAVLFLAAELRHQPAFYGVLQSLQPQTSPFWWFLGDLAEPDRFWYFGTQNAISIPLLSSFFLGPISSVNILPIILGFVFYGHQKFLTPQSTVPLTPEQETQQKMIKWISVILFPLFMYNAPAGLSLYFVANSSFAILENMQIRRHIEKHDLLNIEKYKAEKAAKQAGGPRKGWFAQLQQMAEERQKALQNQQRAGGKKR